MIYHPSFKGLFDLPLWMCGSQGRMDLAAAFTTGEMNAAAPHRDRFLEFWKCSGPEQLEGFPFPVAKFPCGKTREDNSLKNSCWLQSLPWRCNQQGRSCDINKLLCLCGHSASSLYNPSVPSRNEHHFRKCVTKACKGMPVFSHLSVASSSPARFPPCNLIIY